MAESRGGGWMASDILVISTYCSKPVVPLMELLFLTQINPLYFITQHALT